jgi:putative membrane protein
MTESYNDVSKIHKRYSLTLINPSSRYHSLIISVIAAIITSTTIVFWYVGKPDEIAFRLPLAIGALAATQYLDSRFIKNREYSKSLHMSLFGNLLWLAITLSGIASTLILAKDAFSIFYITEGMLIFASYRIGLLTTTLGLSMKKAWAICLLQPLAMYLALVPANLWASSLSDPIVLSIGVAFLLIASVWSVLTDRAGRPNVKSTHKLVQAYLASTSKKNFSEVESILLEKSTPSTVLTSQIRLCSKDSDFRMVLPEIHPGPYHPIGGSNITYRLYSTMNSSAMVMHSVSDHALNLPSQKEVENYLQSLQSHNVFKKGVTCTEPVVVQINKARVIGLLFEKTGILFLSLSPHGMEDVPIYIKKEIEQFADNRNFEKILIVDCHNAMGKEISETDSQDMLKAAKATLETLIRKESHQIEFGYANSDYLKLNLDDLGPGGIGILCLKINNSKYYVGWADSNNMENGLREYVVDHFAKNGLDLLELCTSDTHYSSKMVRNRTGYYPFGKTTKVQEIADWYLKIAKNAERGIAPASFEILEQKTDVMVMGSAVFEDLSKALDKCLVLSKAFMAGSLALFIATLFL